MMKEHEGILGDEGNVPCLDCGRNYMTIHLCQNSQNDRVEKVGFTVCTPAPKDPT